MERIDFTEQAAFTPTQELLDRVTLAPLTETIFRDAPFQAAIFRVAPGGGIGRHPALVPQILAVLDGSGEVCGTDGAFQPIAAGQAVFWEQGEEHETRTAEGLTAIVIEGEGLRPYRR